MSDHLERLKSELAELEERLDKLRDFFATPVFDSLLAADRGLLREQEEVMTRYAEILHGRLARAPS